MWKKIKLQFCLNELNLKIFKWNLFYNLTILQLSRKELFYNRKSINRLQSKQPQKCAVYKMSKYKNHGDTPAQK